MRLSHQLDIVHYKQRGLTVLKENQPSEYVVFVKQGSFQIVKECFTHSDKQLLDFLDENSQTYSDYNPQAASTINLLGSKKRNTLKPRNKTLKAVTVGYLGEGNVFGDIDVVLNRNYMFTLKSNSVDSEVYLLKKESFRKYFIVYKDSFK